ncbi:MAG: GNAT family N-acetyltransferase [Candidatus Thermoplasmatota archaeon]|nr:GNAT family N-acetyltransferase [Candidatus Thermoplasmatota archaeon]
MVRLWEMLAKQHEEASDHFQLAWDSKRNWAKYLEKKFSEISTKLIVAEEDGEVVGFMLCLLSPNAPIFKERKIGVISDAFVLRERRGKGVTSKMLDVAVRWFRKNKVRTVQLGVAHCNMEGRAVWRSLGFEPYMLYKRLDLGKLEERTSGKSVRKLVKRKKIRA